MGEAADLAIDWLLQHLDEDFGEEVPPAFFDYDPAIAAWERERALRMQADHIKSGGASRDALLLGMRLKQVLGARL